MIGTCERKDCIYRDAAALCNYIGVTRHAKLAHVDEIFPITGPDCAYYTNDECQKGVMPMRAKWDQERARELLAEGKTSREIADEIGVTLATIRNWRHKIKTQERSATEPPAAATEDPVTDCLPPTVEPVRLSVELNDCYVSLSAPNHVRAMYLLDIVGRMLERLE